MTKLVRIFDEFRPTLRGKGNFGRYDQLFEVVRRPNPKTVTLEDLAEYVFNLKEKYPENGFQLREVRLNGRTYYVIDKKSWRRLKGGVRVRVTDRVPIYVDLERQEFYVPQWYVRKRRRLASYIVMRTLGTLGVSTVKYVGVA